MLALFPGCSHAQVAPVCLQHNMQRETSQNSWRTLVERWATCRLLPTHTQSCILLKEVFFTKAHLSFYHFIVSWWKLQCQPQPHACIINMGQIFDLGLCQPLGGRREMVVTIRVYSDLAANYLAILNIKLLQLLQLYCMSMHQSRVQL